MGYYISVESQVKLYVEDIGFGKPVLLVHGWPLNHKMYEYQISQLPKFGYRCIAIDLRGYGRSDRPWHGYTYDRMADDIHAVIQALGLEDAILIGFSMGGAIAIRYMARYYGKGICKLILLGAAAPSFTQRPGYPFGATRQYVDDLIRQGEADRPQMVADFGKQLFARNVSDSFRQWIQVISLEASGHGTISGLISLRDEDLRRDLMYIQVPTFILHGALDQICPFTFAEAMHHGLRTSQLYRFERSGHGIFYDELDVFNPTLLTVLST